MHVLNPYLPPFANYYASCLKQFVLSRKYQNMVQKNIRFSNKHEKQSCYILGTSASLCNMDIGFLKNENLIGINKIYLHGQFQEIFAPGDTGKYLLFPPLHPPINNKTAKSTFHQVEEKVRPHVILFLGTDSRKSTSYRIIREHNIFREHQYYLYYAGINTHMGYYPFRKKHWKMHKPIWTAGAGSVHAILLALYMGFNPIYLIGIDHDYLCHKEYENSHFYNDASRSSQKEYQESAAHNNMSPATHVLQGTFRTFEQYEMIRKNTEAQIINLSKAGILDVFPKSTIQ
jgi:hypothetical protein